MQKRVFNNVDDFTSCVGETLGVSQCVEISQDMINKFAELTMDQQWIHTNPVRAKEQSPHGTTIAHGYFVLSLFTHFLDEIIEVRNLRQVLNYGIDKLTFKTAVPVNSKLRMEVSLKSARDLGDICKATFMCRFETEDNNDSVVEGSIVFLYYFNEQNN